MVRIGTPRGCYIVAVCSASKETVMDELNEMDFDRRVGESRGNTREVDWGRNDEELGSRVADELGSVK